MELYHPEKYRVVTGNGQGALCTGWSDPERITKENTALQESVAIIGALYSPNGINHIIRNLCLNPYIHEMYLWRHEDLSKTEFGTIASNTLMHVWEEGVDEKRKHGNFTLEEEIPLDMFEKVRKNVIIHDVSDVSLQDLHTKIRNEKQAPYMDPISFPDPVVKAPDTFASEKYGWAIHSETIYEAWLKVVDRIERYGIMREVENGISIKELHCVVWTITNQKENYPKTDLPDEVQTAVGAKPEMIDKYKDIFLNPQKDPNISYTYGERMFAYKDTEKDIVNQVEESIIRRLKEDPKTRKAYATTVIPRIDTYSDNQPCMVGLQALMGDEGKINCIATFRSHDIYKSALPNAFGLYALQQYICTKAEVPQGALTIVSQSAHIYEQDFDEAKKTAMCFRETISEITAEKMDKRGACIVRIDGDTIILELKSPFGDVLQTFESKTANEMVKTLGHLDLLQQSGHALDIGVQLARAEIAIKKGIPFIQDKDIEV